MHHELQRRVETQFAVAVSARRAWRVAIDGRYDGRLSAAGMFQSSRHLENDERENGAGERGAQYPDPHSPESIMQTGVRTLSLLPLPPALPPLLPRGSDYPRQQQLDRQRQTGAYEEQAQESHSWTVKPIKATVPEAAFAVTLMTTALVVA
jgi:hypothetical protein